MTYPSQPRKSARDLPIIRYWALLSPELINCKTKSSPEPKPRLVLRLISPFRSRTSPILATPIPRACQYCHQARFESEFVIKNL